MNARITKSKAVTSVLISALFLVVSSGLMGCEYQPKSLFEQQAEAESAHKIETSANTSQQVAIITPVASSKSAKTPFHIIKQQTTAKQPNCDPELTNCQYLELNVLDFNPAQPWLNSIMWQTIARVLAPETPLASQDETVKKTVSMLFNQIEYTEQGVPTLPMYQRIDTELVLNSTVGQLQANDSRSVKTNEFGTADTGYLVVRSGQQRGLQDQMQLSYVMLDMQKKLQLTIKDILLPQVTTDELLLTLQTANKDWLALQSKQLQNAQKENSQDDLLSLSQQWYLDDKGLHMVYQSGELLAEQTEVADLMVPYTLLQDLIKPQYIVQTSVDTKE